MFQVKRLRRNLRNHVFLIYGTFLSAYLQICRYFLCFCAVSPCSHFFQFPWIFSVSFAFSNNFLFFCGIFPIFCDFFVFSSHFLRFFCNFRIFCIFFCIFLWFSIFLQFFAFLADFRWWGPGGGVLGGVMGGGGSGPKFRPKGGRRWGGHGGGGGVPTPQKGALKPPPRFF